MSAIHWQHHCVSKRFIWVKATRMDLYSLLFRIVRFTALSSDSSYKLLIIFLLEYVDIQEI